jgi:hypothetical protein
MASRSLGICATSRRNRGVQIEFGGRKIAWVPDNEFLQGYTGPPEDLHREHPVVAPYRKMIEFLSDVDVLIHEAQYTNDEYLAKIGWGHCCLSNACLLMKFANVPRWIVTHHDPGHDDAFLEHKLSMTRQILERIATPSRSSMDTMDDRIALAGVPDKIGRRQRVDLWQNGGP